jgi:hypothetical protein
MKFIIKPRDKTLITDYISRYNIKYERIRSNCFPVSNFFNRDFKHNLSVAPAIINTIMADRYPSIRLGIHYFCMFQ